MAELTPKEQQTYSLLLNQLKSQLDDLKQRGVPLDASIKQTENRNFVFAIHLFPRRCLSLDGYIQQMSRTLSSLQDAVNKQLPQLLIKHECELFLDQFQVLLQLIQGLEKGEAERLYNSYSFPKEQIYQQLQKQYQYEHRLLTMVSEQEELLLTSDIGDRAYIREKIAALKIRYQKCNTFTQKLEFKLEEIKDE